MDSLSYFWLFLVIVTLIAEALTAGLVTIWFSTGGILAFAASFFTQNVFIQTAVFIIVSIVAILTTRPLVKKKIHTKKERTNADSVIGKTAVVTEEINPALGKGQVSVSGKVWSAKSDEKIEKGETVDVLSIEGVKLVVK